MAIVQFPEPTDLKLNYEQTITDGKNIDLNPWSVENPHPGFGKDPNILNEYGHTEYPMFIYNSKIELNPDGSSKPVIVNNKMEYEQHQKINAPVQQSNNNGWPNGN